jgi:hypothetical protein
MLQARQATMDGGSAVRAATATSTPAVRPAAVRAAAARSSAAIRRAAAVTAAVTAMTAVTAAVTAMPVVPAQPIFIVAVARRSHRRNSRLPLLRRHHLQRVQAA